MQGVQIRFVRPPGLHIRYKWCQLRLWIERPLIELGPCTTHVDLGAEALPLDRPEFHRHSVKRIPGAPSDLMPRDETAFYPTNFNPMSEESLRILSKRGEQITASLLDACAPHL